MIKAVFTFVSVIVSLQLLRSPAMSSAMTTLMYNGETYHTCFAVVKKIMLVRNVEEHI